MYCPQMLSFPHSSSKLLGLHVQYLGQGHSKHAIPSSSAFAFSMFVVFLCRNTGLAVPCVGVPDAWDGGKPKSLTWGGPPTQQ